MRLLVPNDQTSRVAPLVANKFGGSGGGSQPVRKRQTGYYFPYVGLASAIQTVEFVLPTFHSLLTSTGKSANGCDRSWLSARRIGRVT